ncbi:MAG TPA: XRE family transcriptional regulator [Candidatus Rifleibacterium sp.]|nr:XRE family transcriptional regulator [Candidatus Rifleibacterium sp.]
MNRKVEKRPDSNAGKIPLDVHDSSGNVFLDLGYASDDAEILRLRADMMAEVRKWVSDEGLTPAEAAKILQVSQSRISDLVCGNWEKFSLEALVVLAIRCGFKLSLSKAA